MKQQRQQGAKGFAMAIYLVLFIPIASLLQLDFIPCILVYSCINIKSREGGQRLCYAA